MEIDPEKDYDWIVTPKISQFLIEAGSGVVSVRALASSSEDDLFLLAPYLIQLAQDHWKRIFAVEEIPSALGLSIILWQDGGYLRCQIAASAPRDFVRDALGPYPF